MKQIEITQNELEEILDSDWEFFRDKIINGNVWCMDCRNGDQTIIDYKIFISERNDIILKGICKKCGNKVGRLLETGDEEKYKQEIELIRSKYKK